MTKFKIHVSVGTVIYAEGPTFFIQMKNNQEFEYQSII